MALRVAYLGPPSPVPSITHPGRELTQSKSMEKGVGPYVTLLG